jgi:hypothetical protein
MFRIFKKPSEDEEIKKETLSRPQIRYPMKVWYPRITTYTTPPHLPESLHGSTPLAHSPGSYEVKPRIRRRSPLSTRRLVESNSPSPPPLSPHPPITPNQGLTPEPLFSSMSNAKPEPLVKETSLSDNTDSYVIYDSRLRLSPVCGRRPIEHDYQITYYRSTGEISSKCTMCNNRPSAHQKPCAKCIDCDMMLCMTCYHSLD